MSTDTEPTGQILAALERLSARLDALEAKVDALGAPASAPAGLERLAGRVDRIEAAVDLVGHVAERMPVFTEAAGDLATWAYEQAVEAGVDPIQAGIDGARIALSAARPEKLALLERLLGDDTLALLGKLLDRSDRLETLLSALDAVPADDLRVLAEQGAAMTSKLAALLQAPELARLLDTGPQAVGLAERASTALVETRGLGADPVGPFAAFLALRDPDVKRAVGFGLAVAKRFGQKLA